ncbi:hypothetical protein [Sphingomonas sp. PB4P5]|uniref:hypothetical protein n=1 Tax=Parasphingomonas puruogangriensis TaxID=3096155 RepID=UPI002FC8EC46
MITCRFDRILRLRFIVSIATAILAAIAPFAAIAAVSKTDHVITIRANDALILAPKEHKAWYEQGIWPVAGAALALIITNGITVGVVYLQSSRSFNALLRQRQIERYAASLNDFYNPLLALMDINKEIFEKTGPPSFPEDEVFRNAAGLVWKQTKKKILANNIGIEAILRTKTHLLGESDSLDSYHRLLVHVAMYETFQRVETDLYRSFLFPGDIRSHIVAQRSAVLEIYYQLTGEQI